MWKSIVADLFQVTWQICVNPQIAILYGEVDLQEDSQHYLGQ